MSRFYNKRPTKMEAEQKAMASAAAGAISSLIGHRFKGEGEATNSEGNGNTNGNANMNAGMPAAQSASMLRGQAPQQQQQQQQPQAQDKAQPQTVSSVQTQTPVVEEAPLKDDEMTFAEIEAVTRAALADEENSRELKQRQRARAAPGSFTHVMRWGQRLANREKRAAEAEFDVDVEDLI